MGGFMVAGCAAGRCAPTGLVRMSGSYWFLHAVDGVLDITHEINPVILRIFVERVLALPEKFYEAVNRRIAFRQGFFQDVGIPSADSKPARLRRPFFYISLDDSIGALGPELLGAGHAS